jgi:hypothetical protein
VVDLAGVEVDNLFERRGRAEVGRERANALEAAWRASEMRHQEKKRRANAALWYTHYSALAASLRRSADGYERRAEALLLEAPGEGGRPPCSRALGAMRDDEDQRKGDAPMSEKYTAKMADAYLRA